jgi:FtsH-binding integral membrane protein
MEQKALSVQGFNVFLSKVFMWMFVGLLTTALTAYVVAATPALLMAIISNRILFFALIIGEVFLVMKISKNALDYSYQKTVGLFLLYSFVNGLTMSIYVIAYTGETVFTAFIISAAMFGVMALYGYVSKTDLSGFGTFFMVAIVGIVIASIVNIFLASGTLSYIISLVGVVIFAGLTAYDMQQMKGLYAYSMQTGGSIEGNIAVTGALRLYLDFINMFIFVLRLLGGRR